MAPLSRVEAVELVEVCLVLLLSSVSSPPNVSVALTLNLHTRPPHWSSLLVPGVDAHPKHGVHLGHLHLLRRQLLAHHLIHHHHLHGFRHSPDGVVPVGPLFRDDYLDLMTVMSSVE